MDLSSLLKIKKMMGGLAPHASQLGCDPDPCMLQKCIKMPVCIKRNQRNAHTHQNKIIFFFKSVQINMTDADWNVLTRMKNQFKKIFLYLIQGIFYLSELDLSDETFKILISIESYEKTSENYRDCYVAEKRIVSKLSKILIPNYDNTNLRIA